MVDDPVPRYWFRRRTTGIGAGRWSLPAAWQGWLAYAVHLVVVVIAAAFAPTSVALAILVITTILLVVVAARFGEPPPPKG